MCGIIIDWNGSLNEDAIKHRGLKKSQIIRSYSRDWDLKVTHFKLPFQTSLEDNWDQPIILENGDLLLFNGEIFNIPEYYSNDVSYLKTFFDSGNYEELIGGPEYNEWDGFWAICIITKRGIYSLTDPLGQKQLYFSDEGIASEMKALFSEDQKVNLHLDFKKPQASEETHFEGIYRMVPNQLYFTGSENKYPELIKPYLFQIHQIHEFPEKYPETHLKELLKESLKRRIHKLESPGTFKNVQNTLFLSGGLDSTILLHLIMELKADHLFEFITIDNGTDNNYIDLLENFYSIKIRRIYNYSMEAYSSATIKEILYQYESPIDLGSLIPNYNLCRRARSSCLITGDGADELFSGYKRAQIEDTQRYDVLTELPFYHNIRLDRMSMMFTKELRSPFMGHEVLRYAIALPYSDRKNKSILKRAFWDIPSAILNRSKEPLRSKDLKKDKENYQQQLYLKFIQTFKK